MDQYTNNSQNEFLWTLLANPANDAHLYSYNLQRLVNDFPQSGILQALLAHASDEKNLKQASVYFNAKSLYKLINTPSAFIGVPHERIIIQPGISSNGRYENNDHSVVAEPLPGQDKNIVTGGNETYFSEHHPEIEIHLKGAEQAEIHHAETEQEVIGNDGINEQHLAEAQPEITNGVVGEHDAAPIAEAESAQEEPDNKVVAENIESGDNQPIAEDNPAPADDDKRLAEHHQPLAEDIHPLAENFPPLAEDNQPFGENKKDPMARDTVPEHAYAIEDEEKQPEKDIEDETYDEIVGIEEINLESKAADKINGEEEKLILGNIADDDYFMFDRAFGEHDQMGQSENNQPGPAANTSDTPKTQTSSYGNTEHQDVSKYHDEKMPYTFMWWLDKTRKEHAGIFQPYAKPGTGVSVNRVKNTTDELQQQYYENIFHITSVEELDKSVPPQTVPFDMKRKEHIIIERFIQEEPQIKPQSSDKLDNENKAKKSSEDRDELVTETLAGIYSDQMLYHKAIASYKKLMLKFPEKSRYFAGKIEQLEKKTN